MAAAGFLSRGLRVLSRTGGYLAWVACALLLAGSWYNFHVYCESFGCMGLGLLWFAWVVALALALLLATLVLALQRRHQVTTRLTLSAMVAMALLGAGHVGYWVVHRVG
ncbi:hypothetical protein GCM10027296_23440 [Chitinimonas naiadis]